MRIPVYATILLTIIAAAGAPAPLHAQTPADPTTLEDDRWIMAARKGSWYLAEQRVTAEVYWSGVTREGPYRATWVRWRLRNRERLPWDSTQFYSTRFAWQRFDCAGQRYQPTTTLWYQYGSQDLVQVRAENAPRPWTAVDTTAMEREIMDLACLPPDLGVTGDLPLGLPASRWTEVTRRSNWTREVDTAGAERHGERLLVWTRDLHGPYRQSLGGGVYGDTFNTHYRLLRVDCQTRMYRLLRQLLAYSDRFVDSATIVGPGWEGGNPENDEYAEINAICGGPPAEAPTSLHTPGALHTGTLAVWHRPGAAPRRWQRRRGRHRRRA